MSNDIQFLTAQELAARLKVPVVWVLQQTKPSVTADPIPVAKFGKHRSYPWGSKKMTVWIERHLP